LYGIATKKCNVKKEEEENRRKPRVTLQIFFSSPLFFSCLYSYSAAVLHSYFFVLPLINLLLLECVLLENPANGIWYQSLVQRSVLGRNLKRKKKIS
jgi:hypothetical protein